MLEMNKVLDKGRALWSKEQIRVLVIASLTMQMFLIFFAPLRKRNRNKLLMLLLWSVYLAADYVATLALGSILTNTLDNTSLDLTTQNLTTFWAPFLLLHLGGPDNITSYSIEDNKLWWRHFIGVIMQVSVAFIVLVEANLQSTKLLVPSILVFVAGTIKFGERTLALHAASKDPIRDPFQNKLDLRSSDDYEASQNGEITDISGADFILGGYNRFFIIKDRMVNTIDPSGQRALWGRKERAFEWIGVELSFFYDIIHTKVIVVHCFIGIVIRIASHVSISIALILFHVSKKHGSDSSDVIITYILLSMALFQETYSLLLLVALKQTTISLLSHSTPWLRNLAEFISRAKNHVFYRGKKRWWSGNMGQYNLIKFSVKTWVRDDEGTHTILNPFKNAWDFLFGDEESAEVEVVLEEMIIQHVQKLVKDVTEKKIRDYEHMLIPGTRQRIIEFPQQFLTQKVIHDFYYLVRQLKSSWISNTLDRYGQYLSNSNDALEGEASFEECVIAWHMATEMSYFALDKIHCSKEVEAIYRISQYMMHLLLKQASMMPPGIAEEMVQDTCKQIRSIFRAMPANERQDVRQALHATRMRVISQRLEDFNGTEERSVKSVLPLFLKVWNDLRDLDVWARWMLLQDVWVEMLTFAALNCSPSEHAKALSRGGELLTHLWLLLAHDNLMLENLEDIENCYDLRVLRSEGTSL